MKIAFLGLGGMGSRMAMSVVRAGHAVTVWNRSAGKAGELLDAGASEADSPARAVEGAELVLSMVMDDEASRAIWTGEGGALAAMSPDAIAVECSTVSPAWCETLADAAARRGLAFLACPVAGTLPHAADGELVIVAGGEAAVLERARPALAAMGKGTHHAGRAQDASTVKLVINGMLAAQEAQLAELLAMAGRLGVDRQRAFDILCETPVASPMLRGYGQMMIDGTDTVNFPVGGILKDLGLIVDACERGGAPSPVAAATRGAFADAADAGLAGRNQTELLRLYES